MINKEKIAEIIKKQASNVGFDAIGFSRVKELIDEKKLLQAWLKDDNHAAMRYMSNNLDKRVNPALLVDGGLSVITVLKTYYPADNKLSLHYPKIARFAYGKDYHFVMKEKLNSLFSFIKKELYPDLTGRCFVDSAPILEKSFAVNAGLGWIGKNSMLINKNLGSYFFIGEIVINLELPYNVLEVKNGCGKCKRCIENCPTNAISENKCINSNKCISYHTIENKGNVPEDIKNKLNGWIFGCDICQEVCPWNRMAKPTNETDFMPSKELSNITEDDWQKITEARFDVLFYSSTIKRTGKEKKKRNINNTIKAI
jgi:epoxyqueuosine reductase